VGVGQSLVVLLCGGGFVKNRGVTVVNRFSGQMSATAMRALIDGIIFAMLFGELVCRFLVSLAAKVCFALAPTLKRWLSASVSGHGVSCVVVGSGGLAIGQ
jgi:hypothetical protein